MSKLETVAYYLWCIVTLGGVWLFKIVMKKAMIEANQAAPIFEK